MRLWSIHPQYLDRQGLLALWRESLLAQKVLAGETSGYRNHPQLERFRRHPEPMSAIGFYLYCVYQEAAGRGYHFAADKISVVQREVAPIEVSDGQIRFEFALLMDRLRTRDPERYQKVAGIREIEPHPIFRVVSGDVELWERQKPPVVSGPAGGGHKDI
ncbi:MAG: hypothetical protein H5T64_03695 [Chloroflexi bacterium]|nr:hypothetical protein [Chloroflexota bacterium]